MPAARVAPTPRTDERMYAVLVARRAIGWERDGSHRTTQSKKRQENAHSSGYAMHVVCMFVFPRTAQRLRRPTILLTFAAGAASPHRGASAYEKLDRHTNFLSFGAALARDAASCR